MGVGKAALGIAGLALLGWGAFNVAQAIPGAVHTFQRVASQSPPKVRTVKWSPGRGFSPLRHGSAPNSSTTPGGPISPVEPTTSNSSSAISATSLNWAGIVQQGQGEKSIQASWKAPSFSTTSTNPNSAVAEWIGLGGMQSRALIQIGTITTPNSSGQAATTVFWEELPSSAVQVATIPQGATVSAKIEPAGTNKWRLWLEVQGQSTPLINQVVTVPASQTSAIESSADWITEAPTTKHGLAPLAPVASTTMSNVKANGVPLSKMNANSLQPIGLYDQSGQLIAAPASSTAHDTLTVNTVYGNLPQASEPGGTWVVQQPGAGSGYGWGGMGGQFPGGSGYSYNGGWGNQGVPGGGGWVTVQPGNGNGVSWSISF